ncbi:putative WRKY transcription factor 3 [Wolffia australiana]
MAKEGGELPGALIASFLGEDNEADYRSYSQLLAGALAVPPPPILPKSAFWSFSGGEDRHGSSPFFPLLDSPPPFSPHPGVFAMTHQEITTQAEDSIWVLAKDRAFAETQIEEAQTKEVSLSKPKLQASSLILDDPFDDGYTWKKYGQKVVKGSECPRSYFKCTYPKCNVKKKVERSVDGQVSSILYNGEHNHPQPSPSKRCRDIGSGRVSGRPDQGEESGSERSSGSGNEEEEEEEEEDDGFEERRADGVDPEFCSKRRRLQTIAGIKSSSSQSTVTKPKIIVQTTSTVDLLDDGYRWRKYGQKVVKGNLNPRSYYKCTSLGCNVRKHIERDSTNPNAVITTYEGKHNHNVPAARNNSKKTACESFSMAEVTSVKRR